MSLKQTKICPYCLHENVVFEITCDGSNNTKADIDNKVMNVAVKMNYIVGTYFCEKCFYYLPLRTC